MRKLVPCIIVLMFAVGAVNNAAGQSNRTDAQLDQMIDQFAGTVGRKRLELLSPDSGNLNKRMIEKFSEPIVYFLDVEDGPVRAAISNVVYAFEQGTRQKLTRTRNPEDANLLFIIGKDGKTIASEYAFLFERMAKLAQAMTPFIVTGKEGDLFAADYTFLYSVPETQNEFSAEAMKDALIGSNAASACGLYTIKSSAPKSARTEIIVYSDTGGSDELRDRCLGIRFAQALGLRGGAFDPDSIFFREGKPGFSEFDLTMLSVLYRNEIQSGKTIGELRSTLKTVIRSLF